MPRVGAAISHHITTAVSHQQSVVPAGLSTSFSRILMNCKWGTFIQISAKSSLVSSMINLVESHGGKSHSLRLREIRVREDHRRHGPLLLHQVGLRKHEPEPNPEPSPAPEGHPA